MAKNINFEQLLEYVVNGESAKAEELFHQLVVLKSREIYENIIEDEMKDVDIDEASEEEDEEMDEAMEEEDDEEMDEATESDDEEMDENFGMEAFGGDETDDLIGDVGDEGESDDDGMDMGDDDMDMGDEEGGSDHDVLMDLKSDLQDLMAKFDSLMGDEMNEPEHNDGIDDPDFGGMDDGEGDMGMGDEEDDESMMPGAFEEEIEEISLSPSEQMREYVEKIGAWEKAGIGGEGGEIAKGGRYTPNTKSIVASKNDMGGSAKNIVNGGTEKSPVEANKGQLRGDGVMGGKPKDMNTGNVNKVGGTNTKQFYKANTKGHGAEKKGEAEGKTWGTGGNSGSVDKKSLLGK